MNLPKRRKAPKMGVRENNRSDEAFKAFVIKFGCEIGHGCFGPLDPHHLRHGVPYWMKGGMGQQPHDHACVCLCRKHHEEFHRIGRETFAKRHNIDLPAINEQRRKQYAERETQ